MESENKYFFTLHKFNYQEYEVWRQLCKFEDYNTGITGYTVNQLVIGADKEAKLTTQKVRTILKNFKKQGYIEDIENGRGTKGRETKIKLTMKQQLFNNDATNKSEQLQHFEDIANNDLTIKQQQSNNTTKNNKKDNNILYKTIIDYLNEVACTKYKHTIKKTQNHINARISEGFTVEDFKKVIDYKTIKWINTEYEKFLRPETLFGTKFENYLNEANKKVPSGIGTQNKNNNVNSSICNNGGKYSRGVEVW